MHIRRQLLLALKEALTDIPGVKGDIRLTDTVIGVQQRQLPMMLAYGIEDRAERMTASVPGPKPTFRTFRIVVGIVASVEDWEDGILDELTAQVEERVFAVGTPLRAIASKDISYGGGATGDIEGVNDAKCHALAFDFTVPVTEGDPNKQRG